MIEIQKRFIKDYNLAVSAFNANDFISFFRNIRPAIENLSKFLIFDFINDDNKASNLIEGKSSLIKSGTIFNFSDETPKIKPTGRAFPELVPKVFIHLCNTEIKISDRHEKILIKKGLESCCAEMCRYYSIASEIGSHSGKTVLDEKTQSIGCASFFMGFFDFINSKNIIKNKTILEKLDKFKISQDYSDLEHQIEILIKESADREAKLKEIQKKELEINLKVIETEKEKLKAEKEKLKAEKETAEIDSIRKKLEERTIIAEQQIIQFETSNQELESEIKKLQEYITNLESIIKSNQTVNNDTKLNKEKINSISKSIKQTTINWDVSEDSMDDDQLDLIEITDNQSMLVSGCAGSGKSVIAMKKAEKLTKNGKDVILIAYTKTLSKFMESGKSSSKFQFYNYHYWKNKLNKKEADYIIVDEIQDFSKEEVLEFINAAKKHFLFFGDSAQSIYNFEGKKTMSIEDISNMTGLKPLFLYNNYRLPRSIAKITQTYVGINVNEYKDSIYQNREEELPHFIHLDSPEKQINTIVEIIKNNIGKKIGILLPNNDNIISLSNELSENYINFEFKYNYKDNKSNSVDNIIFETEYPKIMTYHSAKGLQFDIVILPMYTGANDENAIRALYVAMTRSLKSLYILYSTDNIAPPLNKVPKYLYQTK